MRASHHQNPGLTARAIRDNLGSILSLSTDSFGRLRVSSPWSRYDAKQVDVEPSPLDLTTALNGGTATWQRDYARTQLVSPASADKYAILRTRRRFPYSSGIGQLGIATGNLHTPVNDGFGEMGFFDGSNGFILRRTSTTWQVVLRTSVTGSVTETVKDQEDWNIDTLNGKPSNSARVNPSGITLGNNKGQIFWAAWEWLGLGGVLCGFVIDNEWVPVHLFKHANVSADTYISTPNLPIQWAANSGSGTPAQTTVDAVCGTIITEGGHPDLGYNRADYNDSAAVTIAAGAVRELLSIRLRGALTTDAEPAITSAYVLAEAARVYCATNDPGVCVISYRPTLTGAGTWANPVGLYGANSHVQVCKTGRVATDLGHPLACFPFTGLGSIASEDFDRQMSLGTVAALTGYGEADHLSVLVHNISGSSLDARAFLRWRELP